MSFSEGKKQVTPFSLISSPLLWFSHTVTITVVVKDRLGHEELDCNPGNMGQLDQE